MVSLLMRLLVILVIGSIGYWIVTLLPQPIRQVGLIILAILLLVLLLQALGHVGGRPWFVVR